MHTAPEFHRWQMPGSSVRRVATVLAATLTMALLLGALALIISDLLAADTPCTFINISASIASVGQPGCSHSHDHTNLWAGLVVLMTCPLAYYLTGRAAGWPRRGER